MPSEIISSGPGLENILNWVHPDWELKNTQVIARTQTEGTCITRQPLENPLIRKPCTLLLPFLIISFIRGLLVVVQISVLAGKNVLKLTEYV